MIARRIFDTLGAFAAARDVSAHSILDALPDRGLLADVRRMCAITRSSEVDDLDRRSCTTPGSIAVPVALLLAAEHGLGEAAIHAGIEAGYTTMMALGEAQGGPHRLAEGIWPSFELAPLTAAATAAAVLGLDEERTAHALAIASAREHGRAGRVAVDATSRWLLYGSAAADGVMAALAAEAGAHGDLTLGEPEGDCPLDVSRADFKPFCTARQTQSAVEAALLAHEQLERAPVLSADVEVPGAYRKMIDVPAPSSRLASIVSAHYQLAAAVTDPGLLFDVRRHERPALSLPVRVVPAYDLSCRYPQAWPARVTLRTASATATVEVAGDDAPAPGWDALRAKHERFAAVDVDALLAACRRELDAYELLQIADTRRTVA